MIEPGPDGSQSANINLLFLDPLQSIVAQQFYRISS